MLKVKSHKKCHDLIILWLEYIYSDQSLLAVIGVFEIHCNRVDIFTVIRNNSLLGTTTNNLK